MDPETEHFSDSPDQNETEPNPYPKVDALVKTILSLLDLADYELSLRFVSSDEITELNRQFRGKDSATDVLSFPQFAWDAPLKLNKPLPANNAPGIDGIKPLGDIVICLEVARSNAIDIGQSLEQEICFLLIHGILHLCGHDHIEPEDETLMIEQQKLIMTKLTGNNLNQALWQGCLNGVSD